MSSNAASIENLGNGLLKIYHKDNLRTALFDTDPLSVYLFDKNRRIIATEEMKCKRFVDVMKLCRDWVLYGKYDEADFAA